MRNTDHRWHRTMIVSADQSTPSGWCEGNYFRSEGMRQAKLARRNHSVSRYSLGSPGAVGTGTRIGHLDRPFAAECSHDKATRAGNVLSHFGLYQACAATFEVDEG